jgi:hypothetical protein
VTLRQVGKSVLGVGAGQGVTQGGYTVIGGDARIELGHFGLSLTVENLGNARSNTFSFGNPFGLSQGNQITPCARAPSGWGWTQGSDKDDAGAADADNWGDGDACLDRIVAAFSCGCHELPPWAG